MSKEKDNSMENSVTKTWAPEEIEDIFNRYNNGESYGEIAASYGKSSDSIKGVIRRKKEKTARDSATTDTSVLQTMTPSEETLEINDNTTIMDKPSDSIMTRTNVHSIPSRPHKIEIGKLYTGIALKRRNIP